VSDAPTHREVPELFQREAELGIINSVQTALAARLQLQDICDIVGEKIKLIFDAQVVMIALLDNTGAQLDIPYWIERDERLPTTRIGVFGFRKHVIETKQALLFNDNIAQAIKDYDNPAAIHGETAKSAAFIPMIIGDRVTGVVTLQHLDREFAFTDADVTLLKTVTNTLAVAVENARLFDETQRLLQLSQDRANDLSMLNQMQTALANRKHEQNIYKIVGDQIHAIFDAQVVSIALLDRTRDQFNLTYAIERGIYYPLTSIQDAGYRGHVVATCKPLMINHDFERFTKFGSPVILFGERPKSLLFVPLMVGDAAVGVISIQNLDRENAFSDADATLLSTLANSLTGAIDNARLFDETQSLLKLTEDRANDLEVIGSIGRQITAHLEQDSVIAALNQHVHELLDVHSFRLYRLDADQVTLELALGVEDGQPLAAERLQIEAGSPCERCLSEQAEIIDAPEQTGGSILYAPLMTGDRALGILMIKASPATTYGERDAAILRSLCAYGSIALANSDALAALRQAQATIVQQEKMATLGQLVANVAHEINTPIGAIKSSGQSIGGALEHTLISLPRLFQVLEPPLQQLFMQLMAHTKNVVGMLNTREERTMTRTLTQTLEKAGVPDPREKAAMLVQLRAHENCSDYLPLLLHPHGEFILETGAAMAAIVGSADNINTAVERVAKIVFALKSYSRVDASATLRPIELADSIETVLTIYQNQIKHGVEVVRKYAPLPPLNGLPDELNQVWTNLIHNALQAMCGAGTLTISISQRGSDAVVAIGDSGCGIPQALRGRIFDAFFTTKPAGEGSGLGLDIVKKIIAKHNGRITVESEEGIGSTFSVALPLAATH
jgi:signal transduction histidine kinase